MIVQRREFANYLRKNSSVKGDARLVTAEVRLATRRMFTAR
jgi:hypothetical protein